MAGRPKGAWADKAWRDALRIAVLRPADEKQPKPKNKLDKAAFALIDKAIEGDVQALKEMGDRLDGKVPQAVVGGSEGDQPIRIVSRIELVDLT